MGCFIPGRLEVNNEFPYVCGLYGLNYISFFCYRKILFYQKNFILVLASITIISLYVRSLFNGSLDIMDHERDYATLDKSVRSPIGPVVPGEYTTTGSFCVMFLVSTQSLALFV